MVTATYRLRHKMGHWFWVETTVTNLLHDPDIQAVVLNSRDITQRRTAEHKFMETQLLLGAVVESTNDFIWSVDPERFGLLTFNSRLSKNFLDSRGIYIKSGMTPADLFPRVDFVDIWHDLYKRSLSEGSYVAEYTGKTGSHTLELNFSLVKRDGAVIAISVFGRDITERKLAESKLRTSEEKFKTLFNTADDAIFTMNHTTFLDCNAITEKIFRCTREQIIGHSPVEFSPERQPDGTPSGQSAMEKVDAAFAGEPQSFEWLHTHLDGTTFYADVSLHRVLIGGEYILQAIVRDISERKWSEVADKANKERSYLQRTAIANLAVDDTSYAGDVPTALRRLTEECTVAIQVERASVWLFSEGDEALQCYSLYEAGAKTHSEGAILKASDYPIYFEAIRNGSRIAAGEARTDYRTKEFTAGYLTPLGITSMLDAGIRLEGKLVGVVCFEHVGEKREWHADEEAFASTAAALASQILTHEARKKAEEELRSSEARLIEAQHIAHIGNWELDLQSNNLKWSDEIFNIFEIDKDKFGANYESFLAAIHPDDRQTVNEAYTRSLEIREPYEITHRLLMPDGRIKFVCEQCESRFSLEGKPLVSVGIVQDITERKLAEDERRELNEHFEKSQMISHIGSWEYNVITGTYWGSNEAKRLYGFNLDSDNFTLEEVTNCLIDPERVNKALFDAIESGKQLEIIFDILPRNSTEKRTLQVQASTVKDASGNPIKVAGVLQDITERKRAEDERMYMEQRFSSLVSNIPGIVYRCTNDSSWSMQYISSEVEIVTGYSASDFIYNAVRSFASIIHPDDRDLVEIATQKGVSKNASYTIEYRLCHLDGSFRWVNERGTGVYAPDGNLLWLDGVILDISERKKVEGLITMRTEELAQRNNDLQLVTERLRLAASAASIGVWDWDIVKNELLWDASMYEIYGFPSEYFGGAYEAWSQTIHPDDKAMTEEDIQAALRGEREYEPEFRIVRNDGSIRKVKASSKTFYDKDGKPIRMVGVNFDITTRKQTEEALLTSEKRMRQIIDLVPHFIFAKDYSGKFILANEAVANAYGTTVENLIGKGDADFDPSIDEIEHFLEDDRKVIESGTSKYNIEEFITDSKGSKRILDTTKIPFTASGTNLPSVLGISIDITNQKLAAAERDRLENQLFQAQKMEAIGELAGGIAHDFNNILGSISGFTQMALENVPTDSKASEYLKRVFKSSRRAVDLVNQILTFSRGKEKELKPMMLSPLIKEVLKLISATIPSNIDIRQNITAETDIVMADATGIHQVVMNLCNNASFAMHKQGGVLSVGLVNETILPGNLNHPDFNPGHYLKLTVSDTGEGIDAEVIEKIYDPFFTTKKRGEGTGLGLSVVHGIVKSFGGKITVDSRLGGGTSFDVWLPQADNFLSDNIPEDEDVKSIRGSGKILFVDDEEDLVDMATSMLESLGYEVTATQSSVEALDMFRANPGRFDLVITDQTMPKISGMAMAREMMRIRPGTPIILCTGFSSTLNEEEVKIAGIRQFILKPIIKNDIAASIHQILKTSSDTGDISIPDAPRERFTGVRALVADDQDFNRELIVELLLQVGIEADIAINGCEAVEMVRARDYDILLMDIEMPEMDGLAAAREIRNLEGKGIEILPILALSGHAALSDREESIAAGMNDHLTKPIDTVVLYRALRQWLPQEKYAAVAEDEPDILPIPSVPGLDVEAALKRLHGNRKLYRKLLGSYIPGYGETSAKLLQEVQTGKWEDALRRVHSIKGVAGTLGSTALVAAASKLENLLRVVGSCDSPKLREPLQTFLDCHEDLVANIAAVLPGQSADASAKPLGSPWDAAELRSLLARLKIALESEEPLPCNKIMKELLQKPWPEAREGVIEELNRLISLYRLPEALALLEKEFIKKAEGV